MLGSYAAKALNRDRISYSFEVVLGARITSACNFEIEFRNIILAALRVFEFSHSLDPSRHFGAKPNLVASGGTAEVGECRPAVTTAAAAPLSRAV